MTWANNYIGAEFEAKGRGPKYDCYGLLYGIYKDILKIDLPSLLDDYKNILDRNIPKLLEHEAESWTPIKPGDERSFDAMLLSIKGRPWHCAIVVKSNFMLHITPGIDVVMENYNNAFWKPKVLGFYRYAG